MPTEPRKIIYTNHTPEEISALVAEAYGVEVLPHPYLWRENAGKLNLKFKKTKPYATSVDACLELLDVTSISMFRLRSEDFLWVVEIRDSKAETYTQSKSLSTALCIALLRHKGWEVVV